MKLNIGCANRRISGYVGVDVTKHDAVDVVAPAHDLPFPDGGVDEIMGVHIFEHLYRWDCDVVITEWKRVLKSGGLLVLEMPDLMKTCQNVVDGYMKGGKHPDQMTLWSLYGDPRDKNPWMNHKWAWHPVSLQEFLDSYGFIEIIEKPTVYHPVGRQHRDFRMEARKAP